MISEKVILGIDTSNYTTSVAVVDINGKVIANLKRPLQVKEGERGLRQSDALFLHTVNIPSLMQEAKELLNGNVPIAIGVSSRPRNVEGSYMPCFLAGLAAAESASAVSGIPIYSFSHQCGHIMAAVLSSGDDHILDNEFAAFHISGGTTELVKVKTVDSGFETELFGGTADVNAGQIIDRVGVLMGLRFPAGPHLEKLALENKKKIPKRKISNSGMTVNLSGLENMATKLYYETEDKSLVSAFVLDFIGRSIIAMSEAYESEFGKTTFVYAGGVMCNSIIRKMLSERFDAVFAEPPLSADNAVGVAELARRAFLKEGRF
jgi:N6-L-threonylcarbamoyladenine synthase